MSELRMTHTFVVLGLSNAAYEEIRKQLEEADYQHCFLEDGTIDMTGIAVVREGVLE